jgi:hypothetical protein
VTILICVFRLMLIEIGIFELNHVRVELISWIFVFQNVVVFIFFLKAH